ncbi:MAG: acylphosphatase [Nitrososphaerota archaeon]|nr:acylphosphatase [Nitrososphaerota archaeon]
MSGSDSDTPFAVNVVISGKVQGVFFRSNLRSIAERNAVVGWVRNLPGGEVEALIQGRKKDVEKVLAWCNKGPDRAKVTNVSVKQVDTTQSYSNFAILY